MSNTGGNLVAAMTWGRLIDSVILWPTTPATLPEEWGWIAELIEDEGRVFTITVPGAVADSDQPWRGNAAGSATGATGVFWAYSAKEVDGDHIKRSDQRVILIPDESVDIEAGTKIIDSLDDSSWNVIDVDKISHRSDILVYILQIRQ